MEWLKPIEDRLHIMEILPPDPGEPPTQVDMLAADCRKLVAAVRLSEKEADEARQFISREYIVRAGKKLRGLVDRLRSGDVEGIRAEMAKAREQRNVLPPFDSDGGMRVKT